MTENRQHIIVRDYRLVDDRYKLMRRLELYASRNELKNLLIERAQILLGNDIDRMDINIILGQRFETRTIYIKDLLKPKFRQSLDYII